MFIIQELVKWSQNKKLGRKWLEAMRTFFGGLSRSVYRKSAVLKVHGDGKGGAKEPPPLRGDPSSASAWIEKTVSGESPSSFSASSTVSTEFSEYTPTWSPVSYLKQVFRVQCVTIWIRRNPCIHTLNKIVRTNYYGTISTKNLSR